MTGVKWVQLLSLRHFSFEVKMPQVLERPQVKEVKEPQGFEGPWGEEAHGIIAQNSPMNFIDPEGLYTIWKGAATWYNLPGNRRADGGMFDPNIMAGAMTKEKVPVLGTTVSVESQESCKKITVVINDRGPFKRGPDGRASRPLEPSPEGVIDLTPFAFKELVGNLGKGKVQVEVTVP